MAFEVPPLPYDYDALEPHIDEQTMRLHHDKHHQAYVDNANKALEGTESADQAGRAGARRTSTILPEDKRTAVRNNAGGHANHTLFWEIMGPDGGGEPSGELAPRSTTPSAALDELKRPSTTRGVKRFGSGWTWLVHDGTGLAVDSTANQDSPILHDDVAAARHRRLGARLLPQVPEPAPGLPRGVVERRQLGRRRRAVRPRGRGARQAGQDLAGYESDDVAAGAEEAGRRLRR